MSDTARDPADAVRRRVQSLLGAELSSRWDVEQQLGWAGIMEVSRVLPARHNREMMAKHGLSLTLLSLLGRLEENGPAALQARDLALDLDISPGRVSRHLTTLEAAGLLKRSHNSEDRRGVDVELTKAGRVLLTDARKTAREIIERDFLSQISPREMATLAGVATKVLRAAAKTDD